MSRPEGSWHREVPRPIRPLPKRRIPLSPSAGHPPAAESVTRPAPASLVPNPGGKAYCSTCPEHPRIQLAESTPLRQESRLPGWMAPRTIGPGRIPPRQIHRLRIHPPRPHPSRMSQSQPLRAAGPRVRRRTTLIRAERQIPPAAHFARTTPDSERPAAGRSESGAGQRRTPAGERWASIVWAPVTASATAELCPSVSAAARPYAARNDGCVWRHGMRSLSRTWGVRRGWPVGIRRGSRPGSVVDETAGVPAGRNLRVKSS